MFEMDLDLACCCTDVTNFMIVLVSCGNTNAFNFVTMHKKTWQRGEKNQALLYIIYLVIFEL